MNDNSMPATTPARNTTSGTGADRDPDSKRQAWMRLRTAVADEYASKLPELLPMDEFARLTGMTLAQVRHATVTGDLVVSLRDGRRGIAPVDNIPFLLRERLLRLPSPAARRRRRARMLAVSTAAYERIWDEAIRNSITPGAALDRLLRAAAASPRTPGPKGQYR